MNTVDAKYQFELDGILFIVSFDQDDLMEAPWENEDGHGPVSDWTGASKSPGEMILCSDRGQRRYYDFQEAVKIAKREGWNCAPYAWRTKGQQAHEAALADFDLLRRWCAGDWTYRVVAVTPVDQDGEPDASETLYLGGVAGDTAYLESVAMELASEYLYTLNPRLSYHAVEIVEELGDVPCFERDLLAA